VKKIHIAFGIVLLSLVTFGSNNLVIAESKIVYEIISVDPHSPQKWIVTWDVCANEDVRTFFRISSDIDFELYSFSLGTQLYAGKCLQDLLGHPVLTLVNAKDPKSIAIELEQYARASDQPQVFILEILDTKFSDRYMIIFRICAGNEKLTTPQIVVFSDIAETPTTFSGTVLAPKSCVEHDLTIDAKNKDSIGVQFVSSVDKNTTTNSSDEENAIKKIPDWIKTIFKFYVEGQISENDMIEALQFLIKEGIIKV